MGFSFPGPQVALRVIAAARMEIHRRGDTTEDMLEAIPWALSHGDLRRQPAATFQVEEGLAWHYALNPYEHGEIGASCHGQVDVASILYDLVFTALGEFDDQARQVWVGGIGAEKTEEEDAGGSWV